MATQAEKGGIKDLKTDVAVLKNTVETNLGFLKEQLTDQNKKSDAILDRLDKGTYVSSSAFDKFVTALDKRFESVDKRIEGIASFIEENKTGIKWSNAFVSKALGVLTLALVAAAFGVSIWKIVSLSGH